MTLRDRTELEGLLRELDDVRSLAEALRAQEHEFSHRLHVTHDGDQALAFLKRRAPYAGAPRRDLTLLDLNLPRTDGRAVLAEIKKDESLKDIPVVVLTTSKAEEDILKSYSLHANCYVTKPMGLEQFLDVVRSIEDFWFTIVKLPPK